MPFDSDTAPVRPGEELDTQALGRFLDKGEVVLEQFPGGHSNLTYLVRAGREEYVLRRAPMGPVPPKAHDMAREYRVLESIHPHFHAAPKVHLLCEDPSIIGSAFFLMERRKGIILRETDSRPYDAAFTARVSEAFIDGLIALHAIDIEPYGLSALGKPEGFLDRQVRGWTERWRRAETENIAEMERVIAWLAASIPESGRATIVHNDYKLDNIMLNAEDPGKIEAVLDWEMTTVGDPLADLGLTLCYWMLGSSSGRNDSPGWYSREQLLARYAAKTGRDLSGIAYYEVLGVFKLAVILQQIYYRYVKGQTHDERFRGFDSRVKGLIETASALIARPGPMTAW
ncbi:MAG TPA: phosphotransferase family protein [Edaphobacter sp.]|nr:phosphotransferase family protein [Edaphobacter sp.]